MYDGDIDGEKGLGTGEGEGVLDGLANAKYEGPMDRALEKDELQAQELDELEKVMPEIVCG